MLYCLCSSSRALHVNIDCSDLKESVGDAFKPGAHIIGQGYPVFCDSEGYTVIQSRGQFGNPVDFFFRDWDDYVKGFGEPGNTSSGLFTVLIMMCRARQGALVGTGEHVPHGPSEDLPAQGEAH